MTDKHPFDVMDRLSRLERTELAAAYNSTTEECISSAQKLLFPRDSIVAVAQSNFYDVVQRCRTEYVVWSRKLGEAVLASGDLMDVGNVKGAIQLLEAFIDECKSPFFFQIASSRLENFRGKDKV